jgi:hypothetical protein
LRMEEANPRQLAEKHADNYNRCPPPPLPRTTRHVTAFSSSRSLTGNGDSVPPPPFPDCFRPYSPLAQRHSNYAYLAPKGGLHKGDALEQERVAGKADDTDAAAARGTRTRGLTKSVSAIMREFNQVTDELCCAKSFCKPKLFLFVSSNIGGAAAIRLLLTLPTKPRLSPSLMLGRVTSRSHTLQTPYISQAQPINPSFIDIQEHAEVGRQACLLRARDARVTRFSSGALSSSASIQPPSASPPPRLQPCPQLIEPRYR